MDHISAAFWPRDKSLTIGTQGIVFRGPADVVQQISRDMRRASKSDAHLSKHGDSMCGRNKSYDMLADSYTPENLLCEKCRE